jgi:hypothetical protein
MRKKYVVRLTDQERAVLIDVVKKLKGTSQKVRRAQILLKADADGPAWTDRQIAEAFNCRSKMLDTYALAYNPACPVLCMDEQPVQLFNETRTERREDQCSSRL